jgi:hypothetical protein
LSQVTQRCCLTSPRRPGHYFPYVIDWAGAEKIVERHAKALPFPQHLCDTAFAKNRANFHHRTSRDRDHCTGIFWYRGEGQEEFEVHFHEVRRGKYFAKCLPNAFMQNRATSLH